MENFIFVILFLIAVILFGLDRSYDLFVNNNYRLKKKFSKYSYKFGLPFSELNYILKSPDVCNEHKKQFRKYKWYRIIGLLLLLLIVLAIPIKFLVKYFIEKNSL